MKHIFWKIGWSRELSSLAEAWAAVRNFCLGAKLFMIFYGGGGGGGKTDHVVKNSYVLLLIFRLEQLESGQYVEPLMRKRDFKQKLLIIFLI